jgi:hypothetical protein
MALNMQMLQALLAQGALQPSQDAFGQAESLANRNRGIPSPTPPPAGPAPPGYVDQAQSAIAQDPVNLPQGGPLGAAVGSELSRPGEAAALEGMGPASDPRLLQALMMYLQGLGRS